jgi:hypothetical protein
MMAILYVRKAIHDGKDCTHARSNLKATSLKKPTSDLPSCLWASSTVSREVLPEESLARTKDAAQTVV